MKKVKENIVQEMEFNFTVTDKDSLLHQLRKENKEEILIISHHYFESNADPSFYVRTEEIEKKQKKIKRLTLKYNINDNKKTGINCRSELSINITDIEPFIKLFKIIGLKYRGSKSKKRHLFRVGKVQVTLDEWNDSNLGDRLEIEGPSLKSLLKTKESIIRFIKT